MKFSHYNMDEEENKLDWMFDQAFIQENHDNITVPLHYGSNLKRVIGFGRLTFSKPRDPEAFRYNGIIVILIFSHETSIIYSDALSVVEIVAFLELLMMIDECLNLEDNSLKILVLILWMALSICGMLQVVMEVFIAYLIL